MLRKLLPILAIAALVGFSVYYYQKLTRKEQNVNQDLSLKKVLVSRELRVGSALEELPWGSIDKDTGKEIGGEVEIANLLTKKLGVKLVLVNKSFDLL